jgi:hypothetical protein
MSLATNCVGTKFNHSQAFVCVGEHFQGRKSCGDVAHNKAQERGWNLETTNTYLCKDKTKGDI